MGYGTLGIGESPIPLLARVVLWVRFYVWIAAQLHTTSTVLTQKQAKILLHPDRPIAVAIASFAPNPMCFAIGVPI